MKDYKKILIIAPYAFGYTAEIKNALDAVSNHKVSILYLDQPHFSYKNVWHRIKNFLFKLIGINLKKHFVFDRIKKEVKALEKQDFTFIIRPDILNDSTLKFLKARSQKFVAYYYDSTRRFPRKLDITHFFDTIYSYDSEDVKTYNFKFLTNYIYKEAKTDKYDYLFFNISTYDFRFEIIEACASYLKEKGWSYNIKVYNPTPIAHNHITHITEHIQVSDVLEQLMKTKIIIEIQRSDQTGLSFRVFEALGFRKKLITTNKDIVNYDFYHPQNILVIDEDDITIPEDFVTSPYLPIDESILNPYRIKNWVKRVFELE